MTTTSVPAQKDRPLSMWVRLLVLLAAPPAAWALVRLLPPVTLCVFQRVTGLPCPGCGMTRSMLHLAQGDLVASLRFHPLGVALVALLVAAAAGTAAGLVRGDDPVTRFLERRGIVVTTALLAAFLGLWLVRAFIVPAWAPDAVEAAGR